MNFSCQTCNFFFCVYMGSNVATLYFTVEFQEKEIFWIDDVLGYHG